MLYIKIVILCYFAAFSFLPAFVRSRYQNALARQIEEYVPQIIPAINGSANSLIEETPNISSAATIKNVVSEVNTLLESVCEILFSSHLSHILTNTVEDNDRCIDRITDDC